ncbi:hypothetical protein [Sphingomonas aquatilis]|uniref:Uncharacterized protein n=1 Tax=Sphingomonas aquatilis TaxID=93063 RepID=A0AAW3TRX8_9SPHN|nr:hypothetical protein [Sphingomonas aquatilis]MBB3875342.1 hypothetical protein [Sphingomonas aquatilis]
MIDVRWLGNAIVAIDLWRASLTVVMTALWRVPDRRRPPCLSGEDGGRWTQNRQNAAA